MIRVASYNMRKAIGTDRRRQPGRTIDVLNELGADVIALQEADRRFGTRTSAIPLALLDAHSDYKPVPFQGRAGSIGWHGNAVLVRKAAKIVDQALIEIPSLEPRGAVRADIRLDGEMVRVVGMHLDLSGLWRRRQAAAILDHVNDGRGEMPAVLMGDLNEWSSRGGCLKDFAGLCRFAECGKSFHVRRPVARLDRIMVTEGLEVEDCGVHQSVKAKTASDHFPVWAVLRRG
ncbi:MAG TPA: endonuclease/exonuclease/phosphatase family protein [Allosphingosinicella sp.]|nr:endonuclease/exonuclease/phosphatase family protein [Allosphingosinicella sp.]